MASFEYSDIAQSLEHLRRENKFWRRCTAGAVAVIAIQLLSGAAQRDVPRFVEARDGFILRSPNGKMAASLSFGAGDLPALRFFGHNDNEEPVIALGFAEDGNRGLHLRDSKGKSLMALGQHVRGAVGLWISDSSEQLRLGTAVLPTGEASMAFFESKTKEPSLGLYSDPAKGVQELMLQHGDGSKNLSLGVNKLGEPYVHGRKDGKPSFDLPPSK